jgi:DNA-binding transcriptional ArsR family regulator
MPLHTPQGTPRSTRPRAIQNLVDPKAMRAVAHPTRLALLDALSMHDQLTATQAGEIVGESPTNCAFHLRTLAKYGFIEEAGDAPGRQRPWRRKHLGFTLDGDGDAEGVQAAADLARLLWETWLSRIRSVITAMPTFTDEWQGTTTGVQYLAYLTPTEMRALSSQLTANINQLQDRVEHPERRPPTSIPVEIVVFSYPQQATRNG